MKNVGKLKLLEKLLTVAFTIAVTIVVSFSLTGCGTSDDEVMTISTLEKVVDIEDLSTYEATYNGIAVIYDEKKPEDVDYYVSYKAKVKAGIDFNEIDISMDSKEKVITATLPETKITDVTVDEKELDFIFYDNKQNASGVTEEALKACYADVKEESGQTEALLELAKQNAENTVKALLEPFIKEIDAGYTLDIQSVS